MKIKSILITVTITSFMLAFTACKPTEDHSEHDHSGHDHSGHDHDKHEALEDEHNEGDHENHAEKIPGPNGGRLILSIDPHIEFLVREDRRVQINFLNDELKPVPAGEHLLSLTGGDRANPFYLTFTKDGTSLVSDKPIPEGDNHPGVLQIKANADAKTVFEKFQLNLSDCPSCVYKEYACICEH